MGASEPKIVYLNDGLTDEQFRKVLDPYASNGLDDFDPARAGKGVEDFVDSNREVLLSGIELLSKANTSK